MSDVLTQIRGGVGLITLNRPKALNALSLGMVRELTATLLAWQADPAVHAVLVRGMGKEGPFGAFCAGGDIRFFHRAALAGSPELEDFFTEEYRLNHLIHHYPKPYVAFMDGIVMGGGMGISQGARVRIVTERTRMAMPETHIGLFPDVGGGYFLSRCPGRVGEYLALTGQTIDGAQAVAWGLADVCLPFARLAALWDACVDACGADGDQVLTWIATNIVANEDRIMPTPAVFDAEMQAAFALESVPAIVASLEAASSDAARAAAQTLRHRSPLMLHVVLEQLRRARAMSLAEDLRMERDLVRHCFHLRSGTASETVEGIRALAVDKDHSPRWNPARIEDVRPDQVAAFFVSPWPAHAHPLREL